jgi:hypothetical protein
MMDRREALLLVERSHYNTIRPHASLGYKPPAPEVFVRPIIKEPFLDVVFPADHPSN